jgi:predicted DCC family thiol-disulfide oxidoreductase YuxK
MPTPLILAYDPACALCCRMTLWLARRDRRGLLHITDLRASDLLALAPELAGKPIEKEAQPRSQWAISAPPRQYE